MNWKLCWYCLILGIAFGIIGYVLLRQAKGEEEIHHHPGMTELVDKFYSSWMMPIPFSNLNRRTKSCCNKVDCAPREIKFENGRWFVHWFNPQLKHDVWLPIPENLIEANQPDPRESPDGQSHVCINPNNGEILCAVVGSGQ
jgi:hypothetical protein